MSRKQRPWRSDYFYFYDMWRLGNWDILSLCCVHCPLSCSAFSLRVILILFVEIEYWERLLFETPHYVMNVAERAEDLRILRENLLLVARDYNRWDSILIPASQFTAAA